MQRMPGRRPENPLKRGGAARAALFYLAITLTGV